MASPIGDRAIADAQKYGKAILKFASPNDLGITGGKQAGYYLPYKAWELYTYNRPTPGKNLESDVRVTWQDGRVTDSIIHWYGKGRGKDGKNPRREYRLTKFKETNFIWIQPDNLGSLLVLIPVSHKEMFAYVLDLEDDIQEVQSALGVEISIKNKYAVYQEGNEAVPESDSTCMERKFREFAATLKDFPTSKIMSGFTQEVLESCSKKFDTLPLDKQMMELVEAEYSLFKRIERLLLEDRIVRVFKDVDDFVKTANSITNRRKSRAGHSLEHHTEYLLKKALVPFSRQSTIEGNKKPDILIPSKAAYEDATYPEENIRLVGVKTTCKDRWRQVSSEGNRVKKKHILTIQKGVSVKQLNEMKAAGITLVVPQALHNLYPKKWDGRILTLEQFVKETKAQLEGDGRTYPGAEATQYVADKGKKHKTGGKGKKADSQLGLSL